MKEGTDSDRCTTDRGEGSSRLDALLGPLEKDTDRFNISALDIILGIVLLRRVRGVGYLSFIMCVDNRFVG